MAALAPREERLFGPDARVTVDWTAALDLTRSCLEVGALDVSAATEGMDQPSSRRAQLDGGGVSRAGSEVVAQRRWLGGAAAGEERS
jgi:hypothetical protein